MHHSMLCVTVISKEAHDFIIAVWNDRFCMQINHGRDPFTNMDQRQPQHAWMIIYLLWSVRWNYLSFLRLQRYNLWKSCLSNKLILMEILSVVFDTFFVIISLEYILCLTKITTMAEMKTKILSLYFGFQIAFYTTVCFVAVLRYFIVKSSINDISTLV